MMAERLRPNLVDTMKAVFRTNRISNNLQSDLTPFINTIKSIGEVMFSTLFTVCVLPSNLFRVWDTIFIYGFEAAHKFALAILSKNERLLKNTIKAETKALGIGNTVDALIISGNQAKAKLLTKVEKLPIEKMLKKAISKRTYQNLSRDDFYEQARRIEQDYVSRIQKLKQTKETMMREHTQISKEELTSLFRDLMSSNKDGLISRVRFTDLVTIKFRWEKWLALAVFSSFDHSGNDSISLKELLAGLCIIHSGSIEEKLSLLFITYDTDSSGYLDPEEIIDLICSLENSMDGRSTFFKTQSQSLYKRMDRNDDGKISLEEFIKAAKEDEACKPITEFLEAVNNPGELSKSDLKFIQSDPSYVDVHSPMRLSPMASGKSESSIGSEPNQAFEFPRENISREVEIENLLREDLRPNKKFIGKEVRPVNRVVEPAEETHTIVKQVEDSVISLAPESQSLEVIPEPEQLPERPTTPSEIKEIFEYDSIRVEDIQIPNPPLPEYFSRDSSKPDSPNELSHHSIPSIISSKSSSNNPSHRGSVQLEIAPQTILESMKTSIQSSKPSSSRGSPKALKTVEVDLKRRPSSTSEYDSEYDIDKDDDMYEYIEDHRTNLQTIPYEESPDKSSRRCDRVCAKVDCCIF
jgi:Ca2+-binding EF-hand superfamily protein